MLEAGPSSHPEGIAPVADKLTQQLDLVAFKIHEGQNVAVCKRNWKFFLDIRSTVCRRGNALSFVPLTMFFSRPGCGAPRLALTTCVLATRLQTALMGDGEARVGFHFRRFRHQISWDGVLQQQRLRTRNLILMPTSSNPARRSLCAACVSNAHEMKTENSAKRRSRNSWPCLPHAHDRGTRRLSDRAVRARSYDAPNYRWFAARFDGFGSSIASRSQPVPQAGFKNCCTAM